MTAPGTRVAVYPGSFDPITRGHEDLIRRSRTFADRVIVAVAVNVAKQPLFTLEERVALIRQAVDDASVEVRSFDGLLAEFAIAVGATVIVRGLRAVSDFEYEFQMALMNRNLAPGIETVFLVPAFDLTYLSSSLVREVARFGGDVSPLVHPAVHKALQKSSASDVPRLGVRAGAPCRSPHRAPRGDRRARACRRCTNRGHGTRKGATPGEYRSLLPAP